MLTMMATTVVVQPGSKGIPQSEPLELPPVRYNDMGGVMTSLTTVAAG